MKWVKFTEGDNSVFVCAFIHIYFKIFIAYTWENHQTLKEIILAYENNKVA